MALGEQRVVRGREDLGEATRLRPVQRPGDGHRGPLVDDRQLGLTAAADDREHAVALVEALGVRTARGHLAGQLQARDVRRPARRCRVAPGPLVQIAAVDARGAHPHQHFAPARLGVGMLIDEHLALANRRRAHGGRF